MNRKSITAGCAIAAQIMAICTLAQAASLPYGETFTGPDGSLWPAPWFPGTSHVTVRDIQSNRGRLNGDTQFVSRMILPGYAETDVEVLATFEFTGVGSQGIGLYVRQNGGTLQEYLPHGQGYAVFLKGNWAWPEDLGIWREINGIETQFANGYNPVSGGLLNNTRYRVRFRVSQVDPDTTLLQASVWPEASAEPATWTVESFDTRPELQGTAGSFAIDIYNHTGTSPVYLDDISIERYPAQTGVPEVPGGRRIAMSAPYPHPATGPLSIDVDVPDGAAPGLSVFDVSGRRLARPFAILETGSRTLTWTPVDDMGRRLAAGTYFLSLDGPGSRVVRKLVIAR